MKLALHRSITFWSGLLVMGFICWAWRDSERFVSSASTNPLRAHNVWGGIILERYVGAAPLISSPAFDRVPAADFYKHLPEAFPLPVVVRTRDVPEAEREALLSRSEDAPYTLLELLKMSTGIGQAPEGLLFLPHWLILITVVILWLALLFRRAHRRKRTITP